MFTDTRPVSSSASASEKPLVLVVDDEYGPRESIAFTLSADFAVDTAERAAEALAKLRAKPYAAVILDIRMPEMDGIRALEEIRKFDLEVSVIMLTGYGTLATAQQAMLGGANQYLRKPPDIHELIAAVKKNTARTIDRRRQAKMTKEALDLNSALKREISEKQPQVWQARAAVELVHDLANPLTVMIGYAGLLAEVYLAMTRGQNSLEFASADDNNLGESSAISPISIQLIRRYASADELGEHSLRLAALQKTSKGNCLWLALEQAHADANELSRMANA